MISGHDEQERVGTVLKHQPNLQAHSKLQVLWRELADSKALMPVWMAEPAFDGLQGFSNPQARLLRILPHHLTEGSAQFNGFQLARSFSKSPENGLTVPCLRARAIFLSICFSKRRISSGVTPYSCQA